MEKVPEVFGISLQETSKKRLYHTCKVMLSLAFQSASHMSPEKPSLFSPLVSESLETESACAKAGMKVIHFDGDTFVLLSALRIVTNRNSGSLQKIVGSKSHLISPLINTLPRAGSDWMQCF